MIATLAVLSTAAILMVTYGLAGLLVGWHDKVSAIRGSRLD